MAIFPALVTPVRVVGGPIGPYVGLIGPTGPMCSSTFTGSTGSPGPVGKHGVVGAAGLSGLLSSLTGPRGRIGPTGGDGYQGPVGPTGAFEFIPENRFQTYQNIVGFNLTTAGGAVGCKFYYQPKRPGCILFSMFTGLAEPASNTTPLQLGITSGEGPAPDSGEWSGSYGGAIFMSGQDLSISFMTTYLLDYSNMYGSGSGIPPLRWFDLSAGGGAGVVKNISCIVLEF